jgi:hypothetical protein
MALALKAGTFANFDDSLAAYIDQAMHNEWLAVKGEPLSADDRGADDRKILFAAIAQGLLKFLEDHLDDLITGDGIEDATTGDHHHEMDFSVSTYRTPLP